MADSDNSYIHGNPPKDVDKVLEGDQENTNAAGEPLLAHGEPLTDHGRRKTVSLPSGGELRWRMTPPKAVVGNAKAVLQRVKELGLA